MRMYARAPRNDILQVHEHLYEASKGLHHKVAGRTAAHHSESMKNCLEVGLGRRKECILRRMLSIKSQIA